ncbi:Coenzyme F420 hydrogenase/dehydrogenase, beta subunit C-terminal domain [candidate division KSB1 bacterium]|nr:Coenzyme F420 hydrogenase/dehydrogenase, beta subunit C-terminal domain [candidate division KSB1 bacterium]
MTIYPENLSIAFTHKELCTRSGTCIGVCPTQALSLDKNRYPQLNAELCINCGLCRKVCPGSDVSYKTLTELTFGQQNGTIDFDGHVEKTYVGYAADPRFRKGGAGGGVITALAWHLLKTGQVDGCIVTRMQPERPWEGEVYIARTYNELKHSQQSKYTIIPVNTIFQELQHVDGSFALIALPCQIHGFRKLQREKSKLAAKIKIVIGLFCASSLEPYIADEMLEVKGIHKNDIKDFNFRGGEWPGRIRAILKNGGIKNMHYSNFKDGAINYLMYLYSPHRCQICIDGSSEFADISVSDAWTRDAKGNYIFRSQSRLLARTPLAIDIMESAIAADDLCAHDVSLDPHYKTHKLHARKKGRTAYIRVNRLRRNGHPVPVYDRMIDEHDITRSERRTEKIESLLMRLGRIRAIRLPLFALLTSRYGIPFVKMRQLRKRKKYRS